MLLWKGQLSWKQYIKTKRARFGMETFLLEEALPGYIWSSIICNGDTLNLIYKDTLNAKLKVGEKSGEYCLKYSANCIQWKNKRDKM